MWTAQAYPLNRPRQWLTPVGWARWALVCLRPLARRWRPGSQSVVFLRRRQPDDEYSEMATASENQLDVKIILMNNERWGWYISNRVCSTSRAFLPLLSGKNQLYADCRRIRPRNLYLNDEADPQAALQEIINRPGRH